MAVKKSTTTSYTAPDTGKTVARNKTDVDEMDVRDRLWDSLNYSYGNKRDESNKNYDRTISEQDRAMQSRGMQRSSYNNQTLANLRNEQVKAANDIYDQQIADYENRLYQIERDEKADEQWQKQFDEGVRQFDTNLEYQRERANVEDTHWQNQFDYTKERDLNSDNQWNMQFNYQKERDLVGDAQWQAQFDEGVRQFNAQLNAAGGSGGGGGGYSRGGYGGYSGGKGGTGGDTGGTGSKTTDSNLAAEANFILNLNNASKKNTNSVLASHNKILPSNGTGEKQKWGVTGKEVQSQLNTALNAIKNKKK